MSLRRTKLLKVVKILNFFVDVCIVTDSCVNSYQEIHFFQFASSNQEYEKIIL